MQSISFIAYGAEITEIVIRGINQFERLRGSEMAGKLTLFLKCIFREGYL